MYTDSALSVTSGDFGVALSGDSLLLPIELYDSLRQTSVQPNVVELLALVHSFPNSFRERFGWTADEFQQARSRLIDLLRGHLDSKFLDLTDSPNPALGAINNANPSSQNQRKDAHSGWQFARACVRACSVVAIVFSLALSGARHSVYMTTPVQPVPEHRQPIYSNHPDIVTPSQLDKVFQVRVQEEMNILRKGCSGQIMGQYNPQDTTPIYVNVSGKTQQAKDEVIAEFRAAGWEVTDHNNYLIFKRP